MKLKKLAAAVISSVIAASMLAACGTGTNETSNADTSADIAENETSAAVTEAEVREMRDITAAELASEMVIGWNVGNSLDAVGVDKGLESETAWGNPKITEDLIHSVKEAGFNTLRIPVTWQGHFGEAPDYTIDEAWLARVKEVVDYAVGNDMYAIINIHHDGADTNISWLTPEPSDEAAMLDQFAKLWEQIAAYFEGYDEHLLFAGMNELHHGYNNPPASYLEITDKLNQKFVDTVRASGGNNEKRILIVQAYNTNGEQALKMTVPTDTAKDKLMVEFHFYDPWNFAGSGMGDWGKTGVNTDGWGQEDWVDTLFGKIKAQFVDNGIPAVLGEYGATVNKDGYSNFRCYYITYVTKSAKSHGIIPIYWDNGYDGTSGEGFAIFDRNTNSKLHEDIHKGMMGAAYDADYDIPLPIPPTA